MTTDAQATLLHAADILEIDAHSLLWSCNVDPKNPDWKDAPGGRVDYEDALCTALELRLLAKSLQAGQTPPHRLR